MVRESQEKMWKAVNKVGKEMSELAHEDVGSDEDDVVKEDKKVQIQSKTSQLLGHY